MTRTDLRWRRRHRLVPSGSIWGRLGATWAIDARESLAGERWARNLGTAGPALDARYGSSVIPNTNDPYLATWSGEDYALTYQANSGFIGTIAVPDWAGICGGPASVIVVTYDVDLVDGTLTTCELGGTSFGKLFGQYQQANRWACSTTVGGASQFTLITALGAGPRSGRHLIRFTLNAATGGRRFDWSSDRGATWNYGGEGFAAAGQIESPTGPYYIGSAFHGVATDTVLKVYSLSVVTDGVEYLGPATFAGADPSSNEHTVNGFTWRFQATSVGPQPMFVTSPIWNLGTDDYFTVPVLAAPAYTFDAGEEFTAVLVARRWITNPAYSSFMSSRQNAVIPNGWEIGGNAGATPYRGSIGPAPANLDSYTPAGFTVRAMQAITLRRSAAGMIAGVDQSFSAPNVGLNYFASLAASSFLDIGARYVSGGAAQFSDIQVKAAAMIPRSITDAEIGQITAEFQGR